MSDVFYCSCICVCLLQLVHRLSLIWDDIYFVVSEHANLGCKPSYHLLHAEGVLLA